MLRGDARPWPRISAVDYSDLHARRAVAKAMMDIITDVKALSEIVEERNCDLYLVIIRPLARYMR